MFVMLYRQCQCLLCSTVKHNNVCYDSRASTNSDVDSRACQTFALPSSNVCYASTVNVNVCYPLPSMSVFVSITVMSMFVMLYRQCQCLLEDLPSLSMFVKLYRQRHCLLCSTVNVSDIILYRHVNVC